MTKSLLMNNLGKADNEKVQYVGFDCQNNSYNPGLLQDYLTQANAPFLTYAKSILNAPELSGNYNTEASFGEYLKSLDNLLDTMVLYKPQLISASSEKKYLLYEKILKIIKQVLMVDYFSKEGNDTYRDKFMADNAIWIHDYFDGKKTVIWAHNAHILNGYLYDTGNMGNYLTKSLSTNYVPIGFLFSKGYFNAFNILYNGLFKQEINTEPLASSVNYLMSCSKASVFSVNVADLQKYNDWDYELSHSLRYLNIGATYNSRPDDWHRAVRCMKLRQLRTNLQHRYVPADH